MTKRGGKLTREQKIAAGINKEPSAYALKVADGYGLDDERLGDSWRVTPSSGGGSGANIGQTRKTLKARFDTADILRHQQKIAAAQTHTPAIILPRPDKITRNQKHFSINDNNQIFTENDRHILEPRGWFPYPQVKHITTLAYIDVAHFQNLKNGAIPLPRLPEGKTSKSATYFNAYTAHENSKNDEERWIIERNIVLEPENPNTQVVTEIVYDDFTFSPIEIYRALRGWCNGSEKITPQTPIDHGAMPDAALVISDDAWEHLMNGGKLATQWMARREHAPAKNEVIAQPTQTPPAETATTPEPS